MKESKKEISKKREFASLLKDKVFKLEIELLNNILGKVNKFNCQLQNRKFHLSRLKSEMQFCFNSIFELICKDEKFDSLEFKDLQILDWEDQTVQQEWFSSHNDFLSKLAYRIHFEFNSLSTEDSEIFLEFVKSYQSFISKLLNLLLKYLPFKDEVIGSTDFLLLQEKYPILESKIKRFNELFKVSEKNEFAEQILPQLLRLRTSGDLNFYFNSASDNLSDIWMKISKNNNYNQLAKFARLIEILPVSSSDVEQTFSILKQYRTTQRNTLSEESLEGLLLLFEEYQQGDMIKISQKILELYNELKVTLNLRKNSQRLGSITNRFGQNEEEKERRKQSFQYFLKEMNPTLKLSKKSMSNVQMEAHRNLERSQLIQFSPGKLDSSLLIEGSVGERNNPFETQIEEEPKVYLDDYSYNSLSEDQEIDLNSMDDLIESQKKKVQKALKFKKTE